MTDDRRPSVVCARWGLPEGTKFAALPDPVARALRDTDDTVFRTFLAVLSVWRWEGTQAITPRDLAPFLPSGLSARSIRRRLGAVVEAGLLVEREPGFRGARRFDIARGTPHAPLGGSTRTPHVPHATRTPHVREGDAPRPGTRTPHVPPLQRDREEDPPPPPEGGEFEVSGKKRSRERAVAWLLPRLDRMVRAPVLLAHRDRALDLRRRLRDGEATDDEIRSALVDRWIVKAGQREEARR